MALIQCYECSREISDKAPACPHCGAPAEEREAPTEAGAQASQGLDFLRDEKQIWDEYQISRELEDLARKYPDAVKAVRNSPLFESEEEVRDELLRRGYELPVTLPKQPRQQGSSQSSSSSGCGMIFLVFSGILVAGYFVSTIVTTDNGMNDPDSTEEWYNNRVEAPSAEYKLAVVDAGRDPPPSENVTAIGRDLDYIAPRCSGEQGREHLTDMALSVVDLLRKDGKTRTGQFVLDWTAKMLREPVMQDYRGECAQLFTLSYGGIRTIGE